MWTDVLTSVRYRQNRRAVAERDGELAGIAMSGPPEDVTPSGRGSYTCSTCTQPTTARVRERQLRPSSTQAEPAALRVADPNPRAQAFYRKHGFVADGTARFEDGVREIRMVRSVQHGGTGRSHRL